MPADQLGPLEPLIAEDQMANRTYCGCAHLLKSSVLNHTHCSGGYCVLSLWILWGKVRVAYWKWITDAGIQQFWRLIKRHVLYQCCCRSCLSDPLHFPSSDWAYLGISLIVRILHKMNSYGGQRNIVGVWPPHCIYSCDFLQFLRYWQLLTLSWGRFGTSERCTICKSFLCYMMYYTPKFVWVDRTTTVCT